MIDRPHYKSVPTFRNYEDYHDAEQYTKGWNDAMDYIFPESKKGMDVLEKQMRSLEKPTEIVRCKDCKHRGYWGNCRLLEEKYHQTVLVDGDGFCSKAESEDKE